MRKFIILAVVLLGFGLISGWKMWGIWNQRHWWGVEPYRMIILHGKKNTEPVAIELVTIWPDNFKIASVDIPVELKISSVGGYGSYRTAALIDLGRVEKVGDKLLKDSVGFAFGVPIHQLLWIQDSKINVWKARLDLFKRGVTGTQSIPEVMEVITLMGKVRWNNIENINLLKLNAFKEVLEPDGSVSLNVESVIFDHVVTETISAIWKEAALTQVALINATSKPQIATQWSRLPRVGGFDVVNVSDQQEILDQTQIWFADANLMNSRAGKVLGSLFPRVKLMVGDTSKYRAKIVILLGTDSWSWLNQRQEYLKG